MKYTTATVLTVGLLLSACSTVKHMPAKEGNIMNQDTQQIAGKPDLTAPEVLTKVWISCAMPNRQKILEFKRRKR